MPGLICAAEHYDLPDLIQACFHHAKQFLRTEICCQMLVSLENYYWRNGVNYLPVNNITELKDINQLSNMGM